LRHTGEDAAERQVLGPGNRDGRLHRRGRRDAAVHALSADRSGRDQREHERGKRGLGSSVHTASPPICCVIQHLQPRGECASYRCFYATGKGRARLLIFLTIVNLLYSSQNIQFIKTLKSLANGSELIVTIFDTRRLGARPDE